MKQRHNTRDFVDVLRTWLTVSWMRSLTSSTKMSRIYSIFNMTWESNGHSTSKTLVSELSEDILGKKVEVNINENIISLIFPADS